jgi:hypothetical protein
VRPLEGGKSRPARELAVDAFFGPLAGRLALALLPLRVPPPAVGLANGVAGLVAALAIDQGGLVAAAILLQLKTLLDNADGGLARLSGRVTPVGRYLDSEVDLLVNVALFAALGSLTGQPWLALAAFLVVTLVLSVGFNLSGLYRVAHGERRRAPERADGALERVLDTLYRLAFGWHDRLLRGFSTARLERILEASRTRVDGMPHSSPTTTARPWPCWRTSGSRRSSSCSACVSSPARRSSICGSSSPPPPLLPLLQLRRERLALSALRAA